MLTRRMTMPFIVRDGGDPAGGDPTPPAPTPEPTPTPPPAPAPPAPAHDDSAFARMRREKEAAERAAQEARDALAAKEREEAEEQGRWKDIADAEKARADALEAKQKTEQDKRNAERAARDLRFKDPEYALYLLAQRNVDLADAAAVSTALHEIAESRADLIDASTPPPAPPSGGPPGGNPPEPAGLTAEQLRGMSPQQIAALDPKVVNAALTS